MAAISSVAGNLNWSNPAAWAGGVVVPCKPFAITNCANNGSGLIQITTSSANNWATGDIVNILGIPAGSTTEANGSWVVTVIDSTHADLATSVATGSASVFTNAYTSGGTASRGDTVTIVANSTITVDSSACDAGGTLTVGADPATGGTAAITLTASGSGPAKLNVNANLILRCRGNVSHTGSSVTNTATITMAAGSSLIFGPRSGQRHTQVFDRYSGLVLNGTTNGSGLFPDTGGGNHVTVKTDLSRGGLAAYQTFGGVPQGPATSGTYADFIDMGTTSLAGIQTDIRATNIGNVSLTFCSFTRSNYQCNVSVAWDGNYTFEDNFFASSTVYTPAGATNCCVGFIGMTQPTVGIRKVNRNTFDRVACLAGLHDMIVTNNVFLGSTTAGAGTCTWTNDNFYNNNFLCKVDLTQAGVQGSTRDCYILANAITNPHYLSSPTSGNVHTGWIIESHGSDAEGDIFYGSAGTMTLRKCLVLPDGANSAVGSAGDLISGWTGSVPSFTVEHCTVFGHDNGMMYFGESTGLPVGGVASCKANLLFWPTTPSLQAWLISPGPGTQATDFVTVADYNGTFHPSTGNNTCAGVTQAIPGYSGCKVTAAGGAGANAQLGQHDFQADPQFADQDYRGFLKWYVKVKNGGVPSTIAAALAYIAANPAEIPNLMSWVFAGYRPTNAVYANATYPGDTMTTDAVGNPLNGTVGAMAFQAVGGLLTNPDFTGGFPAHFSGGMR